MRKTTKRYFELRWTRRSHRLRSGSPLTSAPRALPLLHQSLGAWDIYRCLMELRLGCFLQCQALWDLMSSASCGSHRVYRHCSCPGSWVRRATCRTPARVASDALQNACVMACVAESSRAAPPPRERLLGAWSCRPKLHTVKQHTDHDEAKGGGGAGVCAVRLKK